MYILPVFECLIFEVSVNKKNVWSLLYRSPSQTAEEFEAFVATKMSAPDSISKVSFKIEYHPPNTREIWDYNKAETDLIHRSIENIDCSYLLLGKNVQEQVKKFNQTIINIFHNFIPSKTTLYDDRDPPWMND